MHGPEAWTLKSPTRQEVMGAIFTCVNDWPLDRKHSHDLAGFDDEEAMLGMDHSPELQFFALWTLVSHILKDPRT